MAGHPSGARGVDGPLAGLRILELGTLIAGPFAGRLLGDMGAEVIKVEAPEHPDPLRDWGRSYKGRSLWWAAQSRNKKCITLDLRQPAGQQLALDLVEQCDVVIENFRPGTLERWNLAYEQMAAVNPGVILVRVSGYGQTGPYASRAGFASVAEAMSGLRHINGYPDQPPPRMGISLGDSIAALFAVQGALAALHERDSSGTGLGQVVDVSLVESCFALLESAVPEYDRLGVIRQPTGSGLPGIAPSNIFRSLDGIWMVIAANQDTVFRRLCLAMDAPELADDPRFVDHVKRGENQSEIEGIVATWAALRPANEIDQLLNDSGVPCGPINTVADIFDDAHYREREMLLELDDPEIGPFVAPGVVPKFSTTPGSIRSTASWRSGSDNEEVYCRLLALSPADLARHKQHGVV